MQLKMVAPGEEASRSSAAPSSTLPCIKIDRISMTHLHNYNRVYVCFFHIDFYSLVSDIRYIPFGFVVHSKPLTGCKMGMHPR